MLVKDDVARRQLWLTNPSDAEQPLAAAIPLDETAPRRMDALERFWGFLKHQPKPTGSGASGRLDRLASALRVLDGRVAGASYRMIGEALFGKERIDDESLKTSPLRDAVIRDLARQMEADLGTRLDWVAVDHWNTDNPHVHLLVRGVDQNGQDLVISRDYISRGLRARAEELVSIELGPKPEHEIRSALEREVGAERWTRLDAEIRIAADATGHIDLRSDNSAAGAPEIRLLMIGRLQLDGD